MMPNALLFCQLEKHQIPLVNQFYKQTYKKGQANKSEQVFVAKDSAIKCAARLKSVDGALLLTGVACAEESRRQGIAHSLVTHILRLQTQDIYCFPYPHLHAFYQQTGFIDCTPEQLPEGLQTKYQRYHNRKPLLCMIKRAN